MVPATLKQMRFIVEPLHHLIMTTMAAIWSFCNLIPYLYQSSLQGVHCCVICRAGLRFQNWPDSIIHRVESGELEHQISFLIISLETAHYALQSLFSLLVLAPNSIERSIGFHWSDHDPGVPAHPIEVCPGTFKHRFSLLFQWKVFPVAVIPPNHVEAEKWDLLTVAASDDDEDPFGSNCRSFWRFYARSTVKIFLFSEKNLSMSSSCGQP